MDWRAYILSFFITHAPPGTTQYSLEVLPECGVDKENATCALEPVCPQKGNMLCRAPWWADSKKAWVRFESPETAKVRYATIADVMVTRARAALFCEGGPEVASGKDAECVPLAWGQGEPEYRLGSLLGAGAAVLIPESYVREDVQTGRGRSRPKHTAMVDFGEGRGPGNEAGFWQPHPTSAWAFMGYKERPSGDYLNILVGEGREPMVRSVDLFYKMIAHTRAYCGGVAVNPNSMAAIIKEHRWMWRALSMYGTGNSCDSWNAGKTGSRHNLFLKFMRGVSTQPRQSATRLDIARQ